MATATKKEKTNTHPGAKALKRFRASRKQKVEDLKKKIAKAKSASQIMPIIRAEIDRYVNRRMDSFATRTMSLKKLAERFLERQEDFDYIWSALRRAKKAHLYQAIQDEALDQDVVCLNCGSEFHVSEATEHAKEVNKLLARLKELGLKDVGIKATNGNGQS